MIQPKALSIIFGASLALGACATRSLQARQAVAKMDCAPIDAALSTPAETLQAEAERGDAQAQFAWSLVLANGLHGQVDNPNLAAVWRTRATAIRGTTVTQVYLPGDKRRPGSLMPITMPVYVVSLSQQLIVDECIAVLQHPTASQSLTRMEQGACGGAENFVRLRDAWRAAKTQSR